MIKVKLLHHQAVSVQKDGGMVFGHRITGHGTTHVTWMLIMHFEIKLLKQKPQNGIIFSFFYFKSHEMQ